MNIPAPAMVVTSPTGAAIRDFLQVLRRRWRGADVLIHDTTYTPEEYVNHVGWGHSHYLFSLKVADEAGVKRLVLFHHDQTHDDDKVDEIVQKCRKEIKTRGYRFECIAAAEGLELEW